MSHGFRGRASSAGIQCGYRTASPGIAQRSTLLGGVARRGTASRLVARRSAAPLPGTRGAAFLRRGGISVFHGVERLYAMFPSARCVARRREVSARSCVPWPCARAPAVSASQSCRPFPSRLRRDGLLRRARARALNQVTVGGHRRGVGLFGPFSVRSMLVEGVQSSECRVRHSLGCGTPRIAPGGFNFSDSGFNHLPFDCRS